MDVTSFAFPLLWAIWKSLPFDFLMAIIRLICSGNIVMLRCVLDGNRYFCYFSGSAMKLEMSIVAALIVLTNEILMADGGMVFSMFLALKYLLSLSYQVEGYSTILFFFETNSQFIFEVLERFGNLLFYSFLFSFCKIISFA